MAKTQYLTCFDTASWVRLLRAQKQEPSKLSQLSIKIFPFFGCATRAVGLISAVASGTRRRDGLPRRGSNSPL
jgi:hypothetical protein